jgi:hypothetical protein
MARTRDADIPAEERATQLKERIYVTFTALAVVLALSSHASEVSAGEVATTLLITVIVTLGVVGFLAVRRVQIAAWKKVLILLGEVAVGGLVISLELLAHG